MSLSPLTSKRVQLADLALWPICQGGYDASHRAFIAPMRSCEPPEWLLDSKVPLEDVEYRGIKYSRFELVRLAAAAERNKAES